ncbi:MAG: SurA N-terminal domain-containing protein [Candidatus Omnitrophica bacterium]|nr:SurA N-terminal domain-containing protein [Candidatus Omnitrophota bacterium]
MLYLFRKKTKTIAWVSVCAVIFLWGGGTSLLSRQRQSNYVAKIFGKKISAATYDETYKMLYFSPKVQYLLRENPNFDEAMLDDSIFQHIAFLHEARKRNIKVTNDEIRADIVRREQFSTDGRFNASLYERWIKNVTGQSLRQYEEGVRKELTVRNLINSIKKSVSVSDDELKEHFYKEKRKLKLRYVIVRTADFAENVSYTNDDVVAYYQQHLEKFKTKKKYKFNYIVFSPQTFLNDVTVSDGELMSFFENNKNRLADNASAEIPSFDSLKELISNIVTGKKARLIAYDKAKEFKDQITNVSQLSDVAANTGYTVLGASHLTIDEIRDKIGWSQGLEDVFNKFEPSKINIVETSIGFILIHLQSIVQPIIIDFNESEEKVKNLLKADLALQLSEEHAMMVRTEMANTGASFNEIATQYNLSSTDTDFFSYRDNTIINQQITSTVFDHLWNKNIDHISMPIIVNDNSIVIAQIVAIEDPPDEEFEAQRNDIKKQLLEFKQIVDVQQQLSDILRSAEIKIFPANQKENK